jgi:tripartite-type tricarboxylate transporter receptor subunit TctC
MGGLTAWAAFVAAALAITPAAAEYPDRPVKMIIPFAAGGPTDVMARIIAQKLSDKLGKPFIIENQAGAGGNIGTANAARAAPDGYTILVASSSYVVNPSLYKNCPYDPEKDFLPVTLAAVTPNLLIVHPSVPANSAKELIALLKDNPGKYAFASPGIGTTPHLAAELFKVTYHLDFVLAPYRGGGPAVEGVASGQAPVSFFDGTATTEMVKSGMLRALAVTADKRSPALPDVPTSAEAGISGQESETMQGVFVPKGTPQAIVDLLQREIAAIVAMPDVTPKMLPLGFEPRGTSSAEFAAYVKSEVAKWKRLIKEGQIPQIE